MPTDKTTANPKKCHEKRHQTPSEFVTYNTMLAMALSDTEREPGAPLECFARLTSIANYTDRDEKTERRSIASLVDKGWLIPMSQLGSHGANRYRVVLHDEYAQTHDCPPWRYDWETGAPLAAPGEVPLGLWLWSLRRRPAGVIFTAVFDFVRGRGRVSTGQGCPVEPPE